MESEKMSEALRLADALDCRGPRAPEWQNQLEAAAACLRRLHGENESLRAQVEAWTAIAHKHAFILTSIRAALKEVK